MKFEYSTKTQEYDASGAASSTKVILINGEGANVPVFLPADKIGLSNTELYELAMEQIYQENFPQRAEKEKFQEMDLKIESVSEQSKKISSLSAQVASNTADIKALRDFVFKKDKDTVSESNHDKDADHDVEIEIGD